MEGFTILIGLVLFVFGVLQIILFFKLWGMTNNVARMIELLEKHTGLVWTEKNHLKIYLTNNEIEEQKRQKSEAKKSQKLETGTADMTKYY